MVRCGLDIPTNEPRPSEFAMMNADLGALPAHAKSRPAQNRYYEGRHLACLGYGAGERATQLYMMGEDTCRIHRHACPLNLQLYAGGREIFPDIGYIWDHPGNKWAKATASHQTVVIDEENTHWAGPSKVLGFRGEGPDRYVAMEVPLQGGGLLRRAVTLLEKADGLPILIDIMDVEGGRTHDYIASVVTPPKSLKLAGPTLRPRGDKLYQKESYYPLLDFSTGGAVGGGWTATWDQGGQQVRATILTPCAEVITFRSPGWRVPFEITDHPDKYFDTLVLRQKGPKSRYIVVYEVL
jgi:hypothetical protein